MAAITPSRVDNNIEGEVFEQCFYFSSATAADTFTITTYLSGRTIVDISGTNVSDETLLAYTYASNVITVPAGPSTDAIAILVKSILV